MKNKMNDLKKGLYIVSTPIGNLDDISLRAKNILQNSDFIICENPRHSLKLLNNLGIKKKLLSLHDYNEEIVIKKLKKYQDNALIALISDAGSPLISDPGYKLVKNFINNNYFVTSIPGPSAVIPSLQLSGLSINNFVFFGFVPKNKNSIIKLIQKISVINLVCVLLISGKRLKMFLDLVLNNLLDREIAVCKELTKRNEIVFRGQVADIVEKVENKEINLRGEFTIVLGNTAEKKRKTIDKIIINQTVKLLKKYTLTETVEIVHKLSNISKKDVYRMALKINK